MPTATAPGTTADRRQPQVDCKKTSWPGGASKLLSKFSNGCRRSNVKVWPAHGASVALGSNTPVVGSYAGAPVTGSTVPPRK
jgi:hypothetical protein